MPSLAICLRVKKKNSGCLSLLGKHGIHDSIGQLGKETCASPSHLDSRLRFKQPATRTTDRHLVSHDAKGRPLEPKGLDDGRMVRGRWANDAYKFSANGARQGVKRRVMVSPMFIHKENDLFERRSILYV